MKANLLNSIAVQRPKNNVFDLTHDVKLTCNMGELVPIMALECVPGDKFVLSCESLLRFMPLVAPVMHRIDVTMHYFFVPNRLVWPGWEKWIVNDPEAEAFPTWTVSSIAGSVTGRSEILEYMGFPTPPVGPSISQSETVSALAMAAYNCICNEFYRDQNLVEEIDYVLSPGSNNSKGADFSGLKTRAWEHDYFTAALPFAQKGAAVDIPLGDITYDGTAAFGATQLPRFRELLGGADMDEGNVITVANPTPGNSDYTASSADTGTAVGYDPAGTLVTEATTINDLRRAFRLQEWLERNARGGTRYIENIYAHFGVRSSDKRLQRPEYITGTKSPVTISEIVNTTGTTEAPQGNMSGHGVSVTSGKYGSYRCEEHGYIIGIMSVMPKTAYQQGIPKHFLKTTDPFQYYWPSFAHIGEQEVLNKEIYAFQAQGSDTFGYVPRYTEYKYLPSIVTGDFRSTLDFWHLGRIFAEPPALNQEFIECVPDPRIFAVTEDESEKVIAHVLNKVKAIRPMPKFGTPSF